jgi:hypothetical protein
VLLCVYVLGILAQQVEGGCERAEVIIRPDVELDDSSVMLLLWAKQIK